MIHSSFYAKVKCVATNYIKYTLTNYKKLNAISTVNVLFKKLITNGITPFLKKKVKNKNDANYISCK